MRRRFKELIAVLIAVLSVFSGFVIWAETPPTPMQQAFDAIKSNSNVTVVQGHRLVFEPTSVNYSTGFILYLDGRVACASK